jgi:undecaprenol kinase/diacylglycerol kinase (ATP)
MKTTTQPLAKAFTHAFNGLFYFFRKDRNGKIHLSMTIIVALAGWFFGISTTEWIMLLLCFSLVIGLEMSNHALEKLADAAHPEKHPLVGIAKDVAAAAVLWAAIISVIIGLLIFIPKISLLLCA